MQSLKQFLTFIEFTRVYWYRLIKYGSSRLLFFNLATILLLFKAWSLTDQIKKL